MCCHRPARCQMQLSGSCHCKAIRFEVISRTPQPFMHCYCKICRKIGGGSGSVINIMAETKTLKVLQGADKLSIYQVGSRSFFRVHATINDPFPNLQCQGRQRLSIATAQLRRLTTSAIFARYAAATYGPGHPAMQRWAKPPLRSCLAYLQSVSRAPRLHPLMRLCQTPTALSIKFQAFNFGCLLCSASTQWHLLLTLSFPNLLRQFTSSRAASQVGCQCPKMTRPLTSIRTSALKTGTSSKKHTLNRHNLNVI